MSSWKLAYHLHDNRLLEDVGALHAVRRERNRLAHAPGVSLSERFRYGVKENGKPALEVAWTQKVLMAERRCVSANHKFG